ncbi:hypothetical protein B7463_g7073, partial [Scytalidium lignicola]
MLLSIMNIIPSGKTSCQLHLTTFHVFAVFNVAFGEGWGLCYSWIATALSQGYSTLAIDRIGNGLSDHPDPTQIVQIPVHVESIHQIVRSVRAGHDPFPRSFAKVIYVGHSIGSIVGNMLNVRYPTDVDATILTGFSNQFTPAVGNILSNMKTLPAAIVQPSRYGNLETGYLDPSFKPGVQFAFFYPGGYDVRLFDYNYSIRGTITLGEIITVFSTIIPAPQYTGPIYIITGQHDALFCNPLGNSTVEPDCGTHDRGYLEQTKNLYPNTKTYGWYVPPKSGHCWQLHYDALVTFAKAHIWLDENGL